MISFDPRPVYSGIAIARFSDPQGTLRGVGEARVGDDGSLTIEMTVTEELQTSAPYVGGVVGFLRQAREVNGAVQIPAPAAREPNPCIAAQIATAEGTFELLTFEYEIDEHWHDPTKPVVLRFDAIRSQYSAVEPATPEYFLLPLRGLFSEMLPIGALVDYALRFADNQNGSGRPVGIAFEFDGPCFIQPVNTATATGDSTGASSVTAALCGPLAGRSFDTQRYEDWFPFEVLPLLDLATGREVNSPWVEFRDGTGNVVRRIHLGNFQPTSKAGRPALFFGQCQSIGRLLTAALRSQDLRKLPTKAALAHLTQAGRTDFLETQLSHCFEALDGLFNHFDLGRLDAESKLRKDLSKQIRAFIAEVRGRIQGLKSNVDDPQQADLLSRVDRQLDRSMLIWKTFDQKLESLLTKFEFKDAIVLDTTFDGSWARYVGGVRNRIVHDGHLKLDNKAAFEA